MSLNPLSWKSLMECYLTVTCINFPFLDINNKEKLNTEKDGNYQRLTCEEFFQLYKLLGKGIKFLQLITNSFPKIDKDLKTGLCI